MAEKHALIPEVPTIQTDMKESQDISKNLMSGDFERQFRGTMVDEKTARRWHSWLITLGVVVAALVLWLLVFTVVREVQVRQLRHEVDELSAIVIALSANVKSLSHLSSSQMDKNKQLTDFKDVQDTIYADEDLSILDGKNVVKDRAYDSLEKLHGLTVLEDESQGDDEDALDSSDDAESGDWYPDYDKRAEHIGTSDMVHLQPEDFVDTDLGFSTDGDKDMQSNIREIKRRLNENPEDPDIALSIKTDMKNDALIKQVIVPVERLRDKRSVFPDSAADTDDEFAAPRMMAKTEDRRKTKKYSSNAELSPAKMALHTVTRTVRNSDNEEVRRPFIAAHFHGNTSHLNQETHEHYKGNGLVRVNHGAHHDVWYPSQWTAAAPSGHPTLTENGHVHVHHSGVYLVYVQIYYLDDHDVISWVLHRTGRGIEGREKVMQCAQSTHSNGSEKANSCFSASAVFLNKNDRLTVRNTGGDRHSLMQPEKSFIGLIKLADSEDPNQEF